MSSKPLTRLFRVVEELRKLDPEMPMQTASVLLMLADEPRVSQINLVVRAGVSKSAMSRIFNTLSDRPGNLGLLHMDEDPNDMRYKIAKLTSKGQHVLSSLEHLMEG